MRFIKLILAWIVITLLILPIGLLLFEKIVPRFMTPERRAFLRDVDHRVKPGEYGTNSDGIRTAKEAVEFHQEDTNVIFLGDSFVWGSFLPVDQTIPAQFERLAQTQHPDRGINAANFAWVSSSPILSYRLLKDIGPKYNPNIVILCIDMTDFSDDILYRHRIDKVGIFKLSEVAPLTTLSLVKFGRLTGTYKYLVGMDYPRQMFYATNQPLEKSEPFMSYMMVSVNEIYEYTTNDLQARFLVVVLPRGFQYSDRETPKNWEGKEYQALGPYVLEPFRYFDRIRPERPYPIYSLLDDFKQSNVFPTTWETDPHYNQAGAGIAALAIYRICLAGGCFGARE